MKAVRLARLGSPCSACSPWVPRHVRAAERPRTASVRPPVRPTYASRGEIQMLPVQGTVYMLAGAGSNMTVQVGPDAVMVVDTNEAAMSRQGPGGDPNAVAGANPLHRQHQRAIRITSAATSALAKSAEGTVNAILGQGARVYANENTFTRMANPKDGSAPMPTAHLADRRLHRPRRKRCSSPVSRSR